MDLSPSRAPHLLLMAFTRVKVSVAAFAVRFAVFRPAIFGDLLWLCKKKMKANYKVSALVHSTRGTVSDLTSSFPTYAARSTDKAISYSRVMETRSTAQLETECLCLTS